MMLPEVAHAVAKPNAACCRSQSVCRRLTVSAAQPLPVHGHNASCLAHDLAVYDCLVLGGYCCAMREDCYVCIELP